MDRTVIVTGGTGGLGAAVTHALLEDGWRVVVPWYAEQELDRVREHERLDLVQADLTEPASAANVVATAGEDLGALVNLVGGFAMGGRVHETPVEEFEAQLRLNLRPTYLMCAAALPGLLRAGGGAIVGLSSRAAAQPFAGAAGCAGAGARGRGRDRVRVVARRGAAVRGRGGLHHRQGGRPRVRRRAARGVPR